MIGRREFLRRSLYVGLAATAAAGCGAEEKPAPQHSLPQRNDGWDGFRSQFDLDPRITNLSLFLISPHPRPVRDEIERIRHGLDRNPQGYLDRHQYDRETAVARNAARYLGATTEQVAFTDSTTMGLGLAYGGLRIASGQEIVTTAHDFYSTHEALRLRAVRDGVRVRSIRLYRDLAHVTTAEILASIRGALRPETRVLALTWVHSATGLKLPLPAIAALLKRENRRRRSQDRVLLVVDGVHGFGAEPETPAELGCDLFASGCHKWLFGPRGTGVLWARDPEETLIAGTIPSFGAEPFIAWLERGSKVSTRHVQMPHSTLLTPGGLHSIEHRWALAAAFDARTLIGQKRFTTRVAELATKTKQELSEIPGVTVQTPIGRSLSAGLVCFTIAGARPLDIVARLDERKIVATPTPYHTRYARVGLTPVNSESDVDELVRVVRIIAATPSVHLGFGPRG